MKRNKTKEVKCCYS